MQDFWAWLKKVGRFFYARSEVYGIVLSIEHYACVVNILARLGRHGEFESFTDECSSCCFSLEVRPWCLQLENVELGKRNAGILKRSSKIRKVFTLLRDYASNRKVV